jgi:2-dehydropantoate 2-reductase
MNILVFGAGAIGCNVAADLDMAGYRPTVTDPWPAQVDALRTCGLKVMLPDGELQSAPLDACHLCDIASLRRDYDVVLLAVKAQDARWTAEFIKPYVKPDGVVVGLMNGMMDDAIADVVGGARTVGCVLELSAESFEPGVVKRKTPRARTWIGLGELDGGMSVRLKRLQLILGNVARVDLTSNIAGAKWTKLVTNSMILAPFAMLGADSYDALRNPGMLEFIVRIGRETIAVGQDLGYRLEPIFGLTADEMGDEPGAIAEKLATTLAGHIGGKSRNAVMQDLIKGRRTETLYLNGLVAAQGRAAGIATPANDAVVTITQQIERGEREPVPENLAFAKSLLV